jgi:hypothetical protein
MLTHCHVLAQNDALEYTRRIGRLPHDDARTHKSLEKMSAVRRLRLLTRPTRPTAAAQRVGAASPHPHGRRQRLPRVLGEQQHQQRGEHLDVRERQVDQSIASRSRGLGGIVG